MIAMIEFQNNGKTFFSYEFPLEDENSIVGLPWGEGVKAGIAEFRRLYPDASLFDVSFQFDVRP